MPYKIALLFKEKSLILLEHEKYAGSIHLYVNNSVVLYQKYTNDLSLIL